MAIYERVYLSDLSGSWALRVLRGFHKLDCKELHIATMDGLPSFPFFYASNKRCEPCIVPSVLYYCETQGERCSGNMRLC